MRLGSLVDLGLDAERLRALVASLEMGEVRVGAEADAAVHGVPVESVHVHEAGASGEIGLGQDATTE